MDGFNSNSPVDMEIHVILVTVVHFAFPSGLTTDHWCYHSFVLCTVAICNNTGLLA